MHRLIRTAGLAPLVATALLSRPAAACVASPDAVLLGERTTARNALEHSQRAAAEVHMLRMDSWYDHPFLKDKGIPQVPTARGYGARVLQNDLWRLKQITREPGTLRLLHTKATEFLANYTVQDLLQRHVCALDYSILLKDAVFSSAALNATPREIAACYDFEDILVLVRRAKDQSVLDAYERFVTFLRTRDQLSSVNELYTELREVWERVIEWDKAQ